MTQNYSLTEAKAKFSELISRVHFGKERFTITRKGKAVAQVSPISEKIEDEGKEGLICAKGALSELDDVMEKLVETVYMNREKALDRKVDL